MCSCFSMLAKHHLLPESKLVTTQQGWSVSHRVELEIQDIRVTTNLQAQISTVTVSAAPKLDIRNHYCT